MRTALASLWLSLAHKESLANGTGKGRDREGKGAGHQQQAGATLTGILT